jgi:acetylornithine deacetylase
MTSELSPLERRVADEVARRRDDLTSMLCDLVAFDTRAPDPDYAPRDEAALQEYVAARMRASGLAVRVWEPEAGELPRSRYPIPAGHHFGGRPQLVATATGTGGGRTLLFNGHVDVVSVEPRGLWTSDPFAPELRDGRVHGRGACDMKGGVTAILAAVGAALAAGEEPPPFAVHFVVGEEDGGLGAYATLARGHTGDACIIPEPTELRLITANAGSLTFRIVVPGQATHGSTRYAGHSALDAYLPIHAALVTLERRRNADPEPLLRDYPIAYPLSVGRVRSGDWPSSVPDQLVAEGRYGLRIEEDPAAARAELEAAVAEAAASEPFLRDYPPRVSWPGGVFRGGRLPPGDPLGSIVAEAHARVTGRDIGPALGAPYGSDLRLYAGAGIPTLHYGPGSPREAHGPDESVPIEQLLVAARVLELVLSRR